MFYSDNHYYKTIGYTNRGYAIHKLVNVGPITHMTILITSKDWNLLVKSLDLEKIKGTRRTWRLN